VAEPLIEKGYNAMALKNGVKAWLDAGYLVTSCP